MKVGGDLLLETVQDVYKEHSSFISWNAGINVGFDKGSVIVTPTGSYLAHGDKEWADIPTMFNGNDVYVDVGGQCVLMGAGVLGRNTTLNAKSLVWEDIHNKDEREETSYGFDSGVLTGITGIGGAVQPGWGFGNAMTKSGEMISRAGSVVKGWLSFGLSEKKKEGVIRSTISKDAKINLQEPKDLSTLNRDESKMVETTKDEEDTYSIAVPVIDFKELSDKWKAKDTLLQKMIGDKNLPQQEREMLKAEKEVTKVIKAEAIKGGLTPEQAQDVIEELTEEKIVSDNIEKLSEFHEGKEFAVDELEEVLSGKRPTKDKDGQIKFTEPISIKNTKVATVSQDVTLNADNLESKKEALKSKWREFLAEAGDLGISFFVPVAGPPTGAAFSQVVKGERDDTKSLEGLAWGAADFTVVGLLKKVKTGGKLASMVPKGVKLFEETKDLMKVKVIKIEEHHFLTNKHKKYFTEKFAEIVGKYDLKLSQNWNKEIMEHCGRHATWYHKWALEQAKKIDELARGSKEKFLELFEKNIVTEVRAKPEMLKKEYWLKLNQGGPK